MVVIETIGHGNRDYCLKANVLTDAAWKCFDMMSLPVRKSSKSNITTIGVLDRQRIEWIWIGHIVLLICDFYFQNERDTKLHYSLLGDGFWRCVIILPDYGNHGEQLMWSTENCFSDTEVTDETSLWNSDCCVSVDSPHVACLALFLQSARPTE